ncbi:MAG: LCP family protein [Candidatus Berkelbacteria bacterium]
MEPKDMSQTPKKTRFYKTKAGKITFISLGVIIIALAYFLASAMFSGSKIFQNGITGTGILKTLYGQQDLKETDGRTNILFLGMGGTNHPGGTLSDSIIILSVKKADKKAAMISIPRDLQVSIAGYGNQKINAAFADGYNAYMTKNCNTKNAAKCKDEALAAGAKLSADTISKTLNMPIHYTATVEFTGFEKIIDQLGGIDVHVDKAIVDKNFPADNMVDFVTFKVAAGDQHFDGKTALKYARSRESTSDFDRAARQQKIISAIKDKAMKSGLIANPKKLLDIISALSDSVRTDLSPAELKAVISAMGDISSENTISKVLSNSPDGDLIDFTDPTDKLYYLKPKDGNFLHIQEELKNIFSVGLTSGSTVVKVETPAKLEILNSTKTVGLASTVSKDLQLEKTLTITSVGNSKEVVDKTVIYDYSNNAKKEAIALLMAKYNCSVVLKTKSSAEGPDLQLIIGSDYKALSEK